jgi:hypothetical protein
MKPIIVYHGSKIRIEKPLKSLGKFYNDYGQGFYCTENESLSSEWSCSTKKDGIVNEYSLDLKGLKVLRLNEEYNILNWLAILLDNREPNVTDFSKISRDYILKEFLIDYKAFDVIIGYRADDAYFTFVNEFINNQTNLNVLTNAMYLGKLGLQVFIQSEEAFNHLTFLSDKFIKYSEYNLKYQKRVNEANTDYQLIKNENLLKGIFIRDIMNRGVKNEDESIPRIKVK